MSSGAVRLGTGWHRNFHFYSKYRDILRFSSGQCCVVVLHSSKYGNDHYVLKWHHYDKWVVHEGKSFHAVCFSIGGGERP